MRGEPRPHRRRGSIQSNRGAVDPPEVLDIVEGRRAKWLRTAQGGYRIADLRPVLVPTSWRLCTIGEGCPKVFVVSAATPLSQFAGYRSDNFFNSMRYTLARDSRKRLKEM